MAKTKSKRTTARQVAKIRQAHSTTFEDRNIQHAPSTVRRAIKRRPERTGLSYFLHEFPLLSSVIGLALVALIAFNGNSYLQSHKLGFYAPKATPKPLVSGPCGWAKDPANFFPNGDIVRTYKAEPEQCITVATKGSYTATINTSKGTMVMYLDQSLAPRAVNNFVFLATHKFYNGLTFHRVVASFIIQAGDPRSASSTYNSTQAPKNGDDGPGYTFNDNVPTTAKVYSLGAVSMANVGGDSKTSGSQFFIDIADDSQTLQPQYILFGHISPDQVTNVAQKITQGDPIKSITVAFDPAAVPGVIPTPNLTPTPTANGPAIPATATP